MRGNARSKSERRRALQPELQPEPPKVPTPSGPGWWRRWGGVFAFSLVSLGVLAFEVVIAKDRALTPLETALMSGASLVLGVIASWLFGRVLGQESIKPQARSALRRVVTIADGLERVRALIRQGKRDVALDEQNRENMGAHLNALVADMTLRGLDAVVSEQIAAAKDAIQDWGDILPEEAQQLREQYRLQARVAELQNAKAEAEAQVAAAVKAGAEQEERAKGAEQRVAELSHDLAKTERQLATARSSSTLEIAQSAGGTTNVRPAVQVPKDFPARDPVFTLSGALSSVRVPNLRIPVCNTCGDTARLRASLAHRARAMGEGTWSSFQSEASLVRCL